MADYYVRRGGNQAGPFTEARLMKLAASGKIRRDDVIRTGDKSTAPRTSKGYSQETILQRKRNSLTWSHMTTRLLMQNGVEPRYLLIGKTRNSFKRWPG